MCHTFQLQRKTGRFAFEIPAGNMQSLWTYCGNKSDLLINATTGGSLYLLNKSLLDHPAYFTPALVGIKMWFKRSISISWSSMNMVSSRSRYHDSHCNGSVSTKHGLGLRFAIAIDLQSSSFLRIYISLYSLCGHIASSADKIRARPQRWTSQCIRELIKQFSGGVCFNNAHNIGRA